MPIALPMALVMVVKTNRPGFGYGRQDAARYPPGFGHGGQDAPCYPPGFGHGGQYAPCYPPGFVHAPSASKQQAQDDMTCHI